jgi:pimeloyl-ACP methyl ester carboxylesterase
MTESRTSLALPRLRPSDLQGLSQLAADGVVGLSHTVEGMHGAIATLGRRRGRTGGLTGFVYDAVRWTSGAVGAGAGHVLGLLPQGVEPRPSPAREAFVSALNGAWGDHLEATGNPLAIPMSLRIDGRPWEAAALAAPTGRLVVLLHGLGMNDLQWRRAGHDHGQALARDAGFSPVYLHYNTGRHVSTNGADCSSRLDELVLRWPVPVEELVLVGHSMGGLVARSACHLGAERPWRRKLSALVCLGTPHHGAPLERGARLLGSLLGTSPFTAPLALVGDSRSAGITDLRHGNVRDEDWCGRDRHAGGHDPRVPTPWPAGVRALLVAAVTADRVPTRRVMAQLGDGLVPLSSALGEHRDPSLALAVAQDRKQVVTSANHWDLLDRDEVYRGILEALR